MPGSWTEPAIDASLHGEVVTLGRGMRAVRVPQAWEPGRTVVLLLLPRAAQPNGHLTPKNDSTKPREPQRAQGREPNPG